MGLRFFSSLLVLLFSSLIPLNAAPVLRLSSATIGPIAVATAGPTNTQTVEAFNAGDGSLSLSFDRSVTWITATLGQSRQCRTIITAVGQTCQTIQVAIATTGLPQGVSTGILTIKDPNAVDAPQTITVTVRVGPISVDVAPGGSRDVPLAFSSFVNAQAATQSGGDWLGVTTDAFGSFRFNFPYRILFHPATGMAQGTYNGSVAVSGGSNAAENQTLPVSMRVTTLPIATPSTDRLTIRLAEGAPALQYPFSPVVTLANTGQGSLSVSDTSTTGSFLKKDVVPGFFAVDPTGLTAGATSSGSIVFTSNAVNGTVTVPVDLQIVAKAAPTINFQGVLNNATFVPEPVSPGDILVVKGEQLSFSPFTPGPAPPLPTKLGGTSVLLNGAPVPLFYTAYGQIAFQIPVTAPSGSATIQVQRDDGSNSNKAGIEIVTRAPRLLVVVNQDNSINSATARAKPGDVLTIYAIGLGSTSPAVGTGAPAPSAEPLARVDAPTVVAFGTGIMKSSTEPFFAGLTPTFAGLYQVNVVIPPDAPTGAVDLAVSVGEFASNALTLYIQ